MTTNDRERERPLLMALLDMMSVSAETNERAQILRQAYDLLEADAVEIAKLRRSLVRACNATDGGCTDTASSEFLSHVGEEVELCIKGLRALAPRADDEKEGNRE